MSGNLLSCIIARFNVGCYTSSTWERMVLRNGRWRFRWVVVESVRFEVGNFGCGGFRSDKTFGAANIIPDLSVFGTGVARRGGRSEMNSETYGCLGKSFC